MRGALCDHQGRMRGRVLVRGCVGCRLIVILKDKFLKKYLPCYLLKLPGYSYKFRRVGPANSVEPSWESQEENQEGRVRAANSAEKPGSPHRWHWCISQPALPYLRVPQHSCAVASCTHQHKEGGWRGNVSLVNLPLFLALLVCRYSQASVLFRVSHLSPVSTCGRVSCQAAGMWK